MRILASNPDTIGDFVLRQPLYTALIAEGHELALVVRPEVETLAGQVAPGAQVVRLTLNPYSPEASWPVAAGGALAAAEAFAPELLLVAPFQWTPFEELLAERLEGVRRVGLTGRLYRGDIGIGQENVSRLKLDVAVAATADVAEVRKNERLASAVLGRPCTLPDPRLEPIPRQTAAAAPVLAGTGLAKGKFWVACVGDAPFTRVRNWSPELWSLVLSRWAKARGDRFLLTGVMSEAETLTRIRMGMGSWASHAIVAAGEDFSLDALVGCLSASAGYVGRDTGPMHLAAALGKPVLAVFGGGTWPRFLPAASRSCCLTVDVPCAGCDWVCHLPESYCVKRVPAEAVLDAMEALREGRIDGRETRILPPDAATTARLVQGSAASVRERMREAGGLRQEAEATKRRLEQLFIEKSEEVRKLSERVNDTWATLQARQERLDDVSRDLDRSEALRRDLEVKLSRSEGDIGVLLTETRDQGREVQALRARNEQLDAELGRKQALVAVLEAEREQLRIESERLRAEGERLRVEMAQLAADVILHDGRVHALLSSRWRKLGIRLGVAKRLPWEKE